MALKDKLDVWERDLIDMSARNALLHYHTSGYRTSGLTIPIADPSWLYQRIVQSRNQSQKTIKQPELGFPNPDEDPLPLRRFERLRIYARDDMKETGVQTLYLVFGMLDWAEIGYSEQRILSPLILVPITIEPATRGDYSVLPAGDDPIEINPVLREKLWHDFHVRLPTWEALIAAPDTQPADAPASESDPTRPYTTVANAPAKGAREPVIPSLFDAIARIERAIESLPDSIISRHAITPDASIGRFSFTKLVMREDLLRNEAAALAHPALRRIAGERAALRDPSDLVPADQLDQQVRPVETLNILDADSSQEEAIRAAVARQSFVLQGPPGTGKSQTIANIIAESLALGRSVLFVSEKMAALDVVRKRLADNGLGDFLLDLHDAKRNKKDFILELQDAVQQAQRLPGGGSRVSWERQSEDLERRRTQLNDYVRELHQARFALNINAFRAHGEIARLAGAPATSAALPNVTAMTSTDLSERRDALGDLLDYGDVLDTYRTHLWRATPLTSLTGEQTNALNAHFGRLSDALSEASDALSQLRARLGEDAPMTLNWAAYAQARARLALTSPLPPPHWLDTSRSAQLAQMLQDGATGAASYRNAHQRLDAHYQGSIYALDHDTLLRALTDSPKPALQLIQAPAGADPRDTALRERQALDSHLTACERLLGAIGASASAAATLLSVPPPTTIAEASDIAEQAVVVASSPTPPRGWLNPDDYAGARVTSLDAAERAEWAQRTRVNLEERYGPAFFTTDLSAISKRFQERHTSLWRFLNPEYYLDCHAFRQLAREDVAIKQSEIASDAAQIAQLHAHEQWMRDNRGLHASVLGRSYQGDQTDWSKVRELLAWTDRFHSAFGEREAPEAATKLVIAPANERGAIARMARSLAEHLAQWTTERAWMDTALTTRQLVANYDEVSQAPLSAVTAALTGLREALDPFWRAIDTVAATQRAPSAPAIEPCVEMERDVAAARAAHEYDQWITQRATELQSDLQHWYQGLTTDWQAAQRHLEWSRSFRALYPKGVSAALVAWITAPPTAPDADQEPSAIRVDVQRALDRAGVAIAAITAESAHVTPAIARDVLAGGSHSFDETPLERLRERSDMLRGNLPQLKRWVDCGQMLRRCKGLGLNALVEVCLGKVPFPRDIVPIFERQFYTLWLDAARRESPVLRMFSGENQASVISAFRDLDREHIKLAGARLTQVLRQRAYAARARAVRIWEDRGAIRPSDEVFADAYDHLAREAQKKRHPAIRQIVRRVGPALRELKPCWMMSPLSVSQFIETAEPIFDLVIFDEASQVLPEDAICAIMRGKQLIVVGDDKQLPPTNFFAKSLADTGDEDDEEGESAESERTQSVLHELMAADFTSRRLTWHYRSHHESLIAFSNNQFYDDQLITFPGPAANHGEGVKFVFVADGVYDRGRSHTNRREAERVVDELFAIVARDQSSSLGVVALSASQQGAIREALENRFRSHPELIYARDRLNEDSDAEDAFFIKNLESVQGDERDIILLSIGYGKDSKGQVSANFGPINKEGGERRLNVAVTRARDRMIVVSSIHASDPRPSASAGARALRRYLDYAERGPIALRDAPTSVHGESDPEFDSPFEEAVYGALKARGLSVDTQIGCSGYRIDLAIRDEQQPDRYLLGVECDGATFHSSKTARDRDRLRQAHLEGLGWRIHRIWSSDWIANPNREIEKTIEALRLARMKTPPPETSEAAG